MDVFGRTDDGESFKYSAVELDVDGDSITIETADGVYEQDDVSNLHVERERAVWVVERYDDNYYGPTESDYATSFETALELAERQRENHSAEMWEMESCNNNDGMTFIPKGGKGRVTVRERPLHE